MEFVKKSEDPYATSADALIDGTLWEMKSPTASSIKAVERNLKRARWQSGNIVFDSRGGFRVSVEDAYEGGISDPRNETIMKMFALVHVGERAGSGIPNMVKNWTDAGYGKPVLSEQVNPERSTVFLPLSQVSAVKKRQKKAAEKSGRNEYGTSQERKEAILEYLMTGPRWTRSTKSSAV